MFMTKEKLIEELKGYPDNTLIKINCGGPSKLIKYINRNMEEVEMKCETCGENRKKTVHVVILS